MMKKPKLPVRFSRLSFASIFELDLLLQMRMSICQGYGSLPFFQKA